MLLIMAATLLGLAGPNVIGRIAPKIQPNIGT
jgi:hypothetical protein